ncbi:type II toxin-antitoxin system HipA family toxin [Peristeroidobacter soli]|uniref:type II toxin-antitoxin system HipA family toxin n=1 Tax=Peristeroidobacter soli TaxID=2497877 RepID=UPI00101D8429|nr:HipA domain-containing protein [Peristeroidobacter soli]
MPSKPKRLTDAFVWVWLPGTTEPVVAGRLSANRNGLEFNYGRTYLDRTNAISLYDAELPLRAGVLPLLAGLSMPGCIRDAAPDAWGRRVLINRLLGARGPRTDTAQLDELTYLLESGSDRAGALDFQTSATEYVPRQGANATLTELMEAAVLVERGVPLTRELAEALQHGSAIGGARPKALIQDGNIKYLAKFSSSTDLYSVVKAEFIAMRLARYAGLNVASVSLRRSSNKDVLLVERFDRAVANGGWRRKAMVSALTILGLDEMMARYASYEDLAEVIRHRFTDARATLRELFSRLVFNILCGNTDDHARNHAAFWDGGSLALTPAYDICPQPRAGNEASQAMLIAGDDNLSRISTCLASAHHFLLSPEEAVEIVHRQVAAIVEHWDAVCEEAAISTTDRSLLATRQFLNPFSMEGFSMGEARLQ